MEIKIRNGKDFYAGLLFIFFGVGALIESSRYEIGTASRMQAGYFPSILGGALAFFGLLLFSRSFVLKGESVEPFALRPLLLVTLSVLVFGLLLRPLGLVLATLPLVVIGSLAGWKFRLREVVLLYLVLAAMAVGLFVYGLGLTFKVWPL